MILKLVYGKEIHVYDLKAHESLYHVCEKIREIFKKIPDQFILTYKNNQQVEITLDTNQQFDSLVDSLKNDFKTVRLIINPLTSYKPVSTKSQQLIDTKLMSEGETYENTQNIQNVRQLQEWTEQFTNLNMNQNQQDTGKHSEAQEPLIKLQQEKTQQKIQSQYQISQSEQKIQRPLRRRRSFTSSQLSQQDRRRNKYNLIEFQNLQSPQQLQNQTQPQQFQHLIDQPNYKQQQEQQRQNKSQRELHLNFEESSDPQDLIRISQHDQQFEKEKLNEVIKPKQSQDKQQETVPLVENSQQKDQKIKEERKLPKPNSEQKIQLEPSISSKMINPQPLKVQQHQEDFKYHNAKCDICNAFPIYGVRYQCVLCKNYDLCEKCQEKYSHQHPLLKICFTYQTPTKIEVEIPQFSNNKSRKEQQVVLERENLTGWTGEKLNQRILAISSELSELLDVDIQECIVFVRQNQQYTKETLTQLLINRKCQNKNMIKLKNKQQEKHVGGIFGNIKNFFTT